MAMANRNQNHPPHKLFAAVVLMAVCPFDADAWHSVSISTHRPMRTAPTVRRGCISTRSCGYAPEPVVTGALRMAEGGNEEKESGEDLPRVVLQTAGKAAPPKEQLLLEKTVLEVGRACCGQQSCSAESCISIVVCICTYMHIICIHVVY